MLDSKQYRNSLQFLAVMLSKQYGVEVLFGGNQAQTNGKQIIMPVIDLEKTRFSPIVQKFMSRGYDPREVIHTLNAAHIDHEAGGHGAYTDFEALKEVNDPLTMKIVNVIEDPRVDRLNGMTYPGCRTNLREYDELMYSDGPNYPKGPINPVGLLHNYMFSVLIYNMLGHQVMKPFIEVERPMMEKTFPPKFMQKLDGIIAEAIHARDTRHVLELARKVVALLREEKQKQDQQQQSQNSDPSQGEEEQESQNGSSSDDSQSQSDEPKESDGQESSDTDSSDDVKDDQSQENNEQANDQSSTSQEDQDGEDQDGNAPNDSQEQGDEADEQPGQDSSSADSSDEAEDNDSGDQSQDKDEAGDTQNSSEEEQEGDTQTDSSDDSQNQEEESKGSSDSGDESSDSSEEDDGDGQDSGQGDESDSSDDGSEQGQDSEADSGQDQGETQPSQDDAESNDSGSDDEGGESSDNTSLSSMAQNADSQDAQSDLQDVFDALLDPANWENLPKGKGEKLRELINEIAQDCMMKNQGVIPAVQKPYDEGVVKPLDEMEVMSESSFIRGRFNALLQAHERVHMHYKRQGNRIDTRRLYRLQFKDNRIFKVESRKRGVNTAIHFMLDNSGSMKNGERMPLALKSTLALTMALRGNRRFNPALTAFPGNSEMDCTTLLRHGEQYTNEIGIGPQGWTPLGQAVWNILPDLLSCREERKVLFVITDGGPTPLEAAVMALEDARNFGVETYCLGVEVDDLVEGNLEKMFGDNFNCIDSFEDMPEAVFSMLEDVLIR